MTPTRPTGHGLRLKERLHVGRSVTGVVFARAPFGAWVDLGVGFPALLEIICIAGLTPERFRAGDWCPVGSEVTAFIGDFRDRGRQIYLWQVWPRSEQARHKRGRRPGLLRFIVAGRLRSFGRWLLGRGPGR